MSIYTKPDCLSFCLPFPPNPQSVAHVHVIVTFGFYAFFPVGHNAFIHTTEAKLSHCVKPFCFVWEEKHRKICKQDLGL